jgi:16S rRNA G966 N2-methylase RsmD
MSKKPRPKPKPRPAKPKRRSSKGSARRVSPPAARQRKTSSLLDTRVIFCGDNLQKLADFPDAAVDLIYIDPPFNSNRNYEVFWGETREKRSFQDRHQDWNRPLRCL